VASNFMLDEEVPWVSSSSRFLFRGVANESSMNRFPLEAGVRLPRTLSIAGDSAMVVPARFDLLGVAAMLGSMVFNAGRGLDGVPADRQSNKLRIWPSLRGVGPRCIRKAAGVGSISSSSSSSRTSSLSVAGFVASEKGRTAARDLFLLGVAATGCNRLSLVSLSNCTDADGFDDRDSGLVIWGRRSLSYSLYFAAGPFKSGFGWTAVTLHAYTRTYNSILLDVVATCLSTTICSHEFLLPRFQFLPQS